MPRQNQEEYLADVAGAKLEGFVEARELVGKLIDSGLSLTVAMYALDERRTELDSQRLDALDAARASRATVPKPKQKKGARAADPVPQGDPATPDPEPDPSPAGEVIGPDGLRVDPPAPDEDIPF